MNGLLCPVCNRVHFTREHLCWDGRTWTQRSLYESFDSEHGNHPFPENLTPDDQNAAQVARYNEVEQARARLQCRS